MRMAMRGLLVGAAPTLRRRGTPPEAQLMQANVVGCAVGAPLKHETSVVLFDLFPVRASLVLWWKRGVAGQQ